MRMSDYDRWVTTEPEWRTEEVWRLHCEVCGCFLPVEPDTVHVNDLECSCPGSQATPHGEQYASCIGTDGERDYHPHDAHTWRQYMGQTSEWKCTHCGHMNEQENY